MTTLYSSEILETSEQLRSFIPQWNDFLNTASTPHFYQDLEKILIEKQHRKRSNGLLVIVARKADKIVAVAPLLPERRPFKLELGLLKLASFKLRRHKVLGSGIVFAAQANQAECLKFLTQSLLQEKGRFDLLIVDELADKSALRTNSKSLSPYVVKPVNTASETVRQLIMPESYDALMATYSGKKRSEQRRRARQMKKHFEDDMELKRITEPEQVKDFIRATQHIYDNSWKKGVLGTSPAFSETDISYIEQLAAKGWLRSYLLIGKGEPIAYFANFVYRNNCFLEDLGYDNRFKRQGPGSVMIFLIIQDMYEHETPKMMDFGYGDNTYKRIFSNTSHLANESYIVKRPGISWLLVETQVSLRRFYEKIHQGLIYLNIDKAVRKLIKNKRSQLSFNKKQSP